jgi:hypothetical protein
VCVQGVLKTPTSATKRLVSPAALNATSVSGDTICHQIANFKNFTLTHDHDSYCNTEKAL